jgi:hypothetical protein
MSAIRKSATILSLTLTTAWVSGFVYLYKSTKKTNEFDTFFFSLEGLRNSLLIGGAVGLITGSVLC